MTPAEIVEREAGSGSVWVLCLMLALAALAGAVSAAGSVAVQHAQATTAADLAALAAADVLQHAGTSVQACWAARRLAALNGAGIETCQVHGTVVEVTVGLRRAAIGALRVRASARAGPATAAAAAAAAVATAGSR